MSYLEESIFKEVQDAFDQQRSSRWLSVIDFTMQASTFYLMNTPRATRAPDEWRRG